MSVCRPPLRARGFTLLEVLIALAVLAIGLLGLASLQVAALKFNHGAYQRSQAVLLAADIIDRIRANPVGKDAGRYDAVSVAYLPSVTLGECLSAACDSSQLADYDIASWKNAISARLRDGTGAVSTTGTRRIVTIGWKQDEEDMQLVVEADL